MPNRIIKESICTSDKINKLSDFHFRLWVNLITYVDDYGRGDARPAIIKGRCFPLRDKVTLKDIDEALHVMADAGVVSLYTVGGKPLLYLPNWEKHQRIQQKRSLYPAPEEADEVKKQQSTVSHRESPWTTVDHRESPPESNPIQSNPNPNPNPNPKRARAKDQPSVTVSHRELPSVTVENGDQPSETENAAEDRMFEAFWAAYPLHKSRVKAYEQFAAIHPDRQLLEAMILAINRQKKWRHWREGFVPMPAAWLRERRWEDEQEPEITRGREGYSGQRSYDESQMEDILGVHDIFKGD